MSLFFNDYASPLLISLTPDSMKLLFRRICTRLIRVITFSENAFLAFNKGILHDVQHALVTWMLLCEPLDLLETRERHVSHLVIEKAHDHPLQAVLHRLG